MKLPVAILRFGRAGRRDEQLLRFAASGEDGSGENGCKYRRDAAMKSEIHVESSVACCMGPPAASSRRRQMK